MRYILNRKRLEAKLKRLTSKALWSKGLFTDPEFDDVLSALEMLTLQKEL